MCDGGDLQEIDHFTVRKCIAPCGAGPDFIYTKNFARPRSDFTYTKNFARPGSDFIYTKNSGAARAILVKKRVCI